jgi:outer membrane lipoprotein-sorting protein
MASPAVVWLTVLVLGTSFPAPAQSGNAGLESVLKKMDDAAANFHTTEASFVWDQYQKVVDEKDSQKGKVYFRRVGKDTEMLAEITEPEKKAVFYSAGKVQVYEPKIERVTSYDTGKNRADVEGYLVLGFGGSGHDLLKPYEVKYLGSEKVEGVEAAKLELVPKSAKMRNNVDRILLWIDPARGISVQQQFFESSGDYRLARYSAIQLNQKIPDAVFRLKTTGKTKFISPQG